MNLKSPRDAVISVGRIYCDLVFAGLSGMPQMGREVFARSMQPVLGGGAFIAAAHLTHLDRPAALLASYGTDPLSQTLAPQLEESGIDLRFLERRADAGPQVTVVMTDAEDRAFLSCRAGRAVPARFGNALAWERAALLHIAEYATLAEQSDLVSRAKTAGLSVALDPSWDEALIGKPGLLKACAGVDIFLPNAEEAVAITGKSDLNAALDVLVDHFPIVAIKCGGRGALLGSGKARLSASAPKVHLVDTTGAGDAFNAGLIDAYLAGRTLAECLDAGVAAGSLSVQSTGGAPRLATSLAV
ncbi:carbohydrate kinase family protein [Pelagibacterium flavum]|mgnify:FL=1|uniref:Carbohydrate kinase family protein n=1 Tax=Pelagibacterium flavum TaxID=2984530 RepID=A0ABY6IRC7_9HYPH|nr:carbohydrate kinase family protein [Pelagibacterium sp. YIM 151497]MAN78171.1 ribokinase [Hyphomicrobiales bacterium]UYQ71775.1 carbohydrate kinase family protein [Pelagibacterium sp. YIM 151497]|tara:strand:+ start:17 stop:919 length:903 start_codon:yes stop_codon:yes gene_type:complete